MLRLQIPLEPVAAARPKVTRYRTYYPAGSPYAAFRSTAPAAIRRLLPAKWKPYTDPVAVWCEFVFTRPDNPTYFYPSRGDGDNLEKSLYDACNGLIWKDDAHIVTATWSKRWTEPEEESHINLYIEPITEPELLQIAESWRE